MNKQPSHRLASKLQLLLNDPVAVYFTTLELSQAQVRPEMGLVPLPKEAYPHHTPGQILEANAIQSYWENHWAKIVKEQDKKLGKERIEFTVLPEPPFPGIFTFVLCTLDPLLPWRLIKSTYEVALEIDHGQ